MVPATPQRRRRAPATAAAVALLLASPLPLRALELGGATHFVRAPWQAELISPNSTVAASPVWYHLTLRLDAEAGAFLGRITLEQTRGADRDFGFRTQFSRAFLGLPRREGRRVPVRVDFDGQLRRISIVFPEPIAPGETVTVVLQPCSNPMRSDTYGFAVVAWPAGIDPVASPVGYATLRIYDRSVF